MLVWVVKRDVLLNADLNIDSDASRSLVNLFEDLERLIRILIRSPDRWTPST
jgi:hypothetical protein